MVTNSCKQPEIYLVKPKTKPKKKRIRYKVPTYKKFYSVYRYDRKLFREILNQKLKGLNSLTQDEILEYCWLRDEFGQKIQDSDEKSIFRYSSLQRIHELIFNFCLFNCSLPDDCERIVVGGLFCYPEENQAEIPFTWELPLVQRLKLHIKLLRLLRQGKTPEEALLEL